MVKVYKVDGNPIVIVPSLFWRLGSTMAKLYAELALMTVTVGDPEMDCE